jgi:Golgi nucleoside diphosphatase
LKIWFTLQAVTPISLKATAGLRLLPGQQATDILNAVRTYLQSFPFKMAPDAVSILDGACWGQL